MVSYLALAGVIVLFLIMWNKLGWYDQLGFFVTGVVITIFGGFFGGVGYLLYALVNWIACGQYSLWGIIIAGVVTTLCGYLAIFIFHGMLQDKKAAEKKKAELKATSADE